MGRFSISTTKNNVKPQEAIDLYITLKWGSKTDYDIQRMKEALSNTTFVVSARDSIGKLIGLARVFSDGVIHTTIADIVIHPDYRQRGIGKKIMEKIKERYGKTGIFIEAFQRNKKFFENCGYKQKDNMVVLSRRFEDGNKSS